MTNATTRHKPEKPTNRPRPNPEPVPEIRDGVKESSFHEHAPEEPASQEPGKTPAEVIDGVLVGPRMGALPDEPTATRTVRVHFGLDAYTVELGANPQTGDEHLVCAARERVIQHGHAHGRFRHGTVIA